MPFEAAPPKLVGIADRRSGQITAKPTMRVPPSYQLQRLTAPSAPGQPATPGGLLPPRPGPQLAPAPKLPPKPQTLYAPQPAAPQPQTLYAPQPQPPFVPATLYAPQPAAPQPQTLYAPQPQPPFVPATLYAPQPAAPPVRPRPPMIPCPPRRQPLLPPPFVPPPSGYLPPCTALGAAKIEEAMTNRYQQYCPPVGGPQRPLSSPACVPLDRGNTRGGIFGAPWVPGSFMAGNGMSVPQDCPTTATAVPMNMTRSAVPFARSPYASPMTMPEPCPPNPCIPQPCIPQGRPQRQRQPQPCVPQPCVPQPCVPQPCIPDPTVPTPVVPPEVPPADTTPTPLIPGVPAGERPPSIPQYVPEPTTPTTPQYVPTPTPAAERPTRLSYQAGSQLRAQLAPCEAGWVRDASGKCVPQAVRGFGRYGGFGQSQQGVFRDPCGPSLCAPPSIPYARSPYSRPVTVTEPCDPLRQPLPPCPPRNPYPTPRVPPNEPCVPQCVPYPCPPQLPPPRVPPNEPCVPTPLCDPTPICGFGRGPDGLGRMGIF